MVAKQMLNDYQFQLVESFVKRNVNFIVIGGMALKFYIGQQTRDLDLWVPVTGSNKDRLANALNAWLQRYPNHILPGSLAVNNLQEDMHIRLPDADVYYFDADNKPQPIFRKDGIDILTSIKCCLKFDVASDRGSDWICGDVKLRVAALEDVNMLGSYKTPY